MREKGKKPLKDHINITDFNFSAPDSICKVHPSSSPIGICPICLRDRLKNLICSVCGQQNTFFSCSCSELIRNSSSSDVGSVGRISFLIENETQLPIFKITDSKTETEKKQRPSFKIPFLDSKIEKQRPDFDHDHDHEEEGHKKNRFKTILNKFLKKKEKSSFSERKREVWVEGVSRSRSLCSFRESSEFAFSSSAKNSDYYFNSSSERASNFSETEPRKTSFENRMRDREAVDFDDSAFIDLKLCDGKCDIKRGGSCRITEREMRREKKGKKVWRWIFQVRKMK